MTTSAVPSHWVRVNLLPNEVLQDRAFASLRRRLLMAHGALVVLLVAAVVTTAWHAHAARAGEPRVRADLAMLNGRLDALGPVATAQSTSMQLESDLRTVMAGEVSWRSVVGRVRGAAPGGVVVEDVNASLTVAGAADGLDVVNASGLRAIGTVSADGTARDMATLGAYVTALGRQPGIAAPYVASVAHTGSTVMYTLHMLITSAVLTQRFAHVGAP